MAKFGQKPSRPPPVPKDPSAMSVLGMTPPERPPAPLPTSSTENVKKESNSSLPTVPAASNKVRLAIPRRLYQADQGTSHLPNPSPHRCGRNPSRAFSCQRSVKFFSTFPGAIDRFRGPSVFMAHCGGGAIRTHRRGEHCKALPRFRSNIWAWHLRGGA